jgi:transcriptional regulator with XRE-family HTH domain
MSAPPLALRIARWPRRLWPRRFWPGAQTPPAPPAPETTPSDPLRDAGRLVRERREARGWSLRELAERTRISIAVLEALERGWKDRLPEATYLRTMLPLLEHELALPPGCLESVLPAAHQLRAKGPGQSLAAAVFSPFTIHFLTRWQGTVLYAVITLGLLLAVNQQQRRLGSLGLLASSPVPLAVAADTEEAPPGQSRPPLDTAALDTAALHPLSRAAEGVALDLLARDSQRGDPDGSLGSLRLTLKTPTRLDLRSPRGGDWRLESLQGELSLPALPPFELRLSPPPSPGAVTWRGQPLLPVRAGVYAVPAPTR